MPKAIVTIFRRCKPFLYALIDVLDLDDVFNESFLERHSEREIAS